MVCFWRPAKMKRQPQRASRSLRDVPAGELNGSRYSLTGRYFGIRGWKLTPAPSVLLSAAARPKCRRHVDPIEPTPTASSLTSAQSTTGTNQNVAVGAESRDGSVQ